MQSVIFGAQDSWKTFTDTKRGVTFRYPSEWIRNDHDASYGDAMMSADGDRFITGVNWQNGTGAGSPATRTDSFVFAILAPKNAHAYKDRAEKVDDDTADSSPTVQIVNGVTYTHGATQSAGAGHSTQNDVHTTFKNGRCYGFEIISDASFIEDPIPTKVDGDIDPILILKTVHILDVRSNNNK